MKKTAAILVTVAPAAWAGYGGMGNVERDDDSPIDLGGIVLTALVIAAIVVLWKKFF